MADIIDNGPGNELVEALKDQIKKAQRAKFAIGYFFLSGFSLVKEDFPEGYSDLPFLKIVMGNETTYSTKEELVAGFNLRELFKHRMIEDLQKRKLNDEQVHRLKTLKELISRGVIDIKLYDKSRLHAKLYLFLTNPEESYASPGLAVVGSSNFTAEGLTKNRELNALLTSRDDVLYLNEWFDTLWDEAIEFREDLLKVIDYSGVLPESPYPPIGTLVDPVTLFKFLVFKWFDGRVLNLIKRDVLMEFQLVGVENAVKIMRHYNGVILADSVGLGKSFMAAAIVEEFLNGKHRSWCLEGKVPSALLILPPSIISQWEELLVTSEEYFLKTNQKELIKEQNNYKVYEIRDASGQKLGDIGFLSLGIFQNLKESELQKLAEDYELFIVDEAHRFRNKNTKRWNNTRKLQKKAEGFQNKFMLLTATPLNNSINDIFNLIRLFNDDTFAPFRIKGIPISDMIKRYRDLKGELEHRDDDKVKKDLKEVATELKQNVLDEVMVLRTRRYITEQFKDIRINGRPLVFKDPKPFSLDYSPFYSPPYQDLVHLISVKLEQILFEYTKLYGSRFVVFEGDGEEEEMRLIEIADLFKLLLGKRLESGIYPFETTLKRIYKKERIFYELFSQQMDQILNRKDLEETIREAIEKAKLKKELEEVAEEYDVEEEDETWFDRVVSILLDYAEESREIGKDYSELELLKLGLKRVIENLESDLRLMDEIIEKLDSLKERENNEFKSLGKIPKQEADLIDLPIYMYQGDPKLEALKQMIGDPAYKSEKIKEIPSLNRKKIIVFTQYRDTAYYLHHRLEEWIEKDPNLHTWLKDRKSGRIKIGLVTGDTDTPTKINYLKRFAPIANRGQEEAERYGEVEILISTDALSEGVNLQDADVVINYDLPWNPMVIVQRVGRVNRIGNEKDVLVINNIPSEEIEVIVGVLSKLQQKIADITLVVGKETKILSPEEEIKVETFGEKIKDYSKLSITDLEQVGISEDFKKFLPEGIPREQLDEYKLLNFIQFDLGMTGEDFEDVLDMGELPYYTHIKSGTGEIISVYEFYRGKFKIMKKVLSINPGTGEIKAETPLIFKDLIKNKQKSPERIGTAIESLKTLKEETDRTVEELKEGYQQEQKGFLYNLLRELILNRGRAADFRETFSSVVNVLQVLPYYLYTREIKPLLLEKQLIGMERDEVTIKDFEGTVSALYEFLEEKGIASIESLKVHPEHIGWYYGS